MWRAAAAAPSGTRLAGLLATTNSPTPSMFRLCGMLLPQTPSSDTPPYLAPPRPSPPLTDPLSIASGRGWWRGLVAWLIGVHLLAVPGSAGQAQGMFLASAMEVRRSAVISRMR